MAVTADELDLPRRTLMWVAGAFLSMFLFAAVIALSYTLGAREGGFGEPPLIQAAEGPYKIVPEQKGGQTFPHQKIGVYDRISGNQTEIVELLLPPSEQPLISNLIPRTTPRIVDDNSVPGAFGSELFSEIAPNENNNSPVPEVKEPVVVESTSAAKTTPTPKLEDPVVVVSPSVVDIAPAPKEVTAPAPSVVQSDEQSAGSTIPSAETVEETSIAGLIRQSTEQENLVTASPSDVASQPSASNGIEPKIEVAEVTALVAPFTPQSSRLEPVMAEEIMVDPARVVDGKPEPSLSREVMTTEEVLPVTEPQVTLETSEVLAIAPDIIPKSKPVIAAPEAVLPEATKPVEKTGTQIAALDLNETKKAISEPKAMPAGAFLVQIGAFRKKAEAESAWRRASKSHKDLISHLQPSIQRADLGKRGIYFRLRAGPLENKAQARSLCKLLEKRKLACLVPKQ